MFSKPYMQLTSLTYLAELFSRKTVWAITWQPFIPVIANNKLPDENSNMSSYKYDR